MGLKFREWKFVVFWKSMRIKFWECKIKVILLDSSLANDQWKYCSKKRYSKYKKCIYILKPQLFLIVAIAKFQSMKGASHSLTFLTESYHKFYSHLWPNFPVNGLANTFPYFFLGFLFFNFSRCEWSITLYSLIVYHLWQSLNI